MLRPTRHQKQSRNAYKINNIKVGNDDVSAHDDSVHDDSEGYDDDLKDYFKVDNDSSHYNSVNNEPVENDNAASIIEKLREATRKYYQKHAFQEVRSLRYIGNSSRIKRRKNQQQCETAKKTLMLHTF